MITDASIDQALDHIEVDATLRLMAEAIQHLRLELREEVGT